MAKKLGAWNKDKTRQEAVRRLRTQLTEVCAKLPAGDPARASCDGVWSPAKVAAPLGSEL
jgi:hypothetical protein